MEKFFSPPKIELLDFFKGFGEYINEVLMSSPAIQTHCAPILDLTLVFSDIESDEIYDFISELDLPEEKINDLQGFFTDSFRTSFSWGFEEKEFVFIRLEKTSPLIKTENQSGLRGLILHEILHSVQRQRGFDIRLRNSLVFTLDLFEQLAAMVPPENFDKNEIVSFLKEISQVAFLTLKDIYVNYELIKRRHADQLLDYYMASLGFEESSPIIPPRFETSSLLKTGKRDLTEISRAFSYTISLLPTWLPFMTLEVDSIFYETSRNLKKFLFLHYYPADSVLTNEIIISFENILLTSFTFSRSFHVKWFGAIFNIALEFLLWEDFIFYHLAKAVELIEEYYSKREYSEFQQTVIAPILKATYLQNQPVLQRVNQLSGIQKNDINALEELFQRYEIDQEELEELTETIEDKERHEVGHIFQNMLKLSIMILSKNLRQEVVHGRQDGGIKILGRTILTLLQAMNYLGDICDDKYYHDVRVTVKRILRIPDPILQKQLALYLETVTRLAIFSQETDPLAKEVSELVFYFDFFAIPINNETIDLGVLFINNIKRALQKVTLSDPDFSVMVGQLTQLAIKELEPRLTFEDKEEANMILVSSLMATQGIPFPLIQSVVEQFISFSPLSSEEEE